MCRGAGDFWWNEMEYEQKKTIFVCKQHQTDLCTSWYDFRRSKRIRRRSDKKKYCEMWSIAFPDVRCFEKTTYSETTMRKLSKEMSKKVLLNKHVLFHFGIRKSNYYKIF